MLKVDIRNRILKPKVGEIITVIGDIYTTVAETIPDENGRCSTSDHSKRSGNSSNTTGYNFMQRMRLPKRRFRRDVQGIRMCEQSNIRLFSVQESKVEIQTKCYRVLKVKVLI